MAKEFQKNMSTDDRKYEVCDGAHKDMKIYCDTNPFPKLLFLGSHPKPHGAWGLGKNYHLHFDPSLGNGICAIRRIPCACLACTSMPYKPWIMVLKNALESVYQFFLILKAEH